MGRLSNPVQRRLTDTEVDTLAAAYETGAIIDEVAARFGIHRTTVMAHLERSGVPRRNQRKFTDPARAEAARRYRAGETLAEIAATFDVAPSTVARELRLAQVPIRRRGQRVAR